MAYDDDELRRTLYEIYKKKEISLKPCICGNVPVIVAGSSNGMILDYVVPRCSCGFTGVRVYTGTFAWNFNIAGKTAIKIWNRNPVRLKYIDQ